MASIQLLKLSQFFTKHFCFLFAFGCNRKCCPYSWQRQIQLGTWLPGIPPSTPWSFMAAGVRRNAGTSSPCISLAAEPSAERRFNVFGGHQTSATFAVWCRMSPFSKKGRESCWGSPFQSSLCLLHLKRGRSVHFIKLHWDKSIGHLLWSKK